MTTPLTIIMLWVLLCALVVAVIVAGGVLDAALIKLREKAEPPGERDVEDQPVSQEEGLSEYQKALDAIPPHEYKKLYMGGWDDPGEWVKEEE
jgi:hypothetical protein